MPPLFPPSLPAHTVGAVRGEEDRSGAETSADPWGRAALGGRSDPCDREAPPSAGGGGRSLEKGAELLPGLPAGSES